jgi:hypothetical protein
MPLAAQPLRNRASESLDAKNPFTISAGSPSFARLDPRTKTTSGAA